MSYADAIRNYVAEIPLNVILSTREVLNLGTRAAVDLTLSRMVKEATLLRVARGLFVRMGSTIPDLLTIAKAKARAFGRSICSHGAAIAHRFGLTQADMQSAKFCTGGGNTSFASVSDRINFVGICDRKRHLGDSMEGKTIRGFWHMGKETFLSKANSLLALLPASDQKLIARNAAWMPSWMSDEFIRHNYPIAISISWMPLPPVLDIPRS